MILIDAAELERTLQPAALVQALHAMFRKGCEMPVRHHHSVPVSSEADGTLLLMPAWQSGGLLGVKTVTVYPGNPAGGLPTVMGFYALMSASTGELLAFMDARVLTARRTAAASALAAGFLARKDAAHLLMVGTGALAKHMIRAHAVARPIRKVTVYGRSPEKANGIVADLRESSFEIAPATDLRKAVQAADIICCATTATEPVIRGEWIRPGTHIDLVGAFKPDMREADEATIARARVYVDSRSGAMHEAGDLLIPLRQGVIGEQHIQGDLFELCRGQISGRSTAEEVTLFKSVGMALEDLAAAELAYRSRTAPHA